MMSEYRVKAILQAIKLQIFAEVRKWIGLKEKSEKS